MQQHPSQADVAAAHARQDGVHVVDDVLLGQGSLYQVAVHVLAAVHHGLPVPLREALGILGLGDGGE